MIRWVGQEEGRGSFPRYSLRGFRDLSQRGIPPQRPHLGWSIPYCATFNDY